MIIAFTGIIEDNVKLDTFLNMFDTNGDGMIDFNEFIDMVEDNA